MLKAEAHPERLSVPSMISTVLISFGGFLAIGPLAGFLLVSAYYGFDFEKVTKLLGSIGSEDSFRIPLLFIQGLASFTGFMLIPYLLFRLRRKTLEKFSSVSLSRLIVCTVLIFFIVVSFMGVNALLIDWNASVDFPSFMDGFEEWARSSEKRAEISTKFLINFDYWYEFAFGFIVIAIIPGIGEEIVFRGIIQKQLNYQWKNAHAAIWVSAILFSAFHLQFYGFVPRALLGALFGYLYLWSGKLVFPIMGHIINNGLTLTLAYLYKQEIIEYDIQNTEYEFSLVPFLTSLSLFLVFIIYFRKLMNTEKASHA